MTQLTPAQLKHLKYFAMCNGVELTQDLIESTDLHALDNLIRKTSPINKAGKNSVANPIFTKKMFNATSDINNVFNTKEEIEEVKKQNKNIENGFLEYLHIIHSNMKRLLDNIDTPLLYFLKSRNPKNYITSVEANNTQYTIDYFENVKPFEFKIGDIVYILDDKFFIESIDAKDIKIYWTDRINVNMIGLIPKLYLGIRGFKSNINTQKLEYIGKESQKIYMEDNKGRRFEGDFNFDVKINAYKLVT